MEKKNTPKEKVQQKENRDLWLLKIQIYADRCHNRYTMGLSVALVVLGLISVFYALYYESLMTLNIPFALTGWVGIIVVAIFTILTSWYVKQKYRQDFQRISDMIEAVEEGQQLDEPLCELDDWKKK